MVYHLPDPRPERGGIIRRIFGIPEKHDTATATPEALPPPESVTRPSASPPPATPSAPETRPDSVAAASFATSPRREETAAATDASTINLNVTTQPAATTLTTTPAVILPPAEINRRDTETAATQANPLTPIPQTPEAAEDRRLTELLRLAAETRQLAKKNLDCLEEGWYYGD